MKIYLVLFLTTFSLLADPVRTAQNAVNDYAKIAKGYESGGKSKDKNSTPFDAVKSALDTLVSNPDENSVKFLIKLISSKSAPLAARGYAMRQVAKAYDVALASAVVKDVSGGRATPQMLDVLARMKDNNDAKIFARYLRSSDYTTQMAALMGISRAGGIKDISLINSVSNIALKTPRQGMRWAACRALGSSKNKAAVPTLIKCLALPGGFKEVMMALVRITGKDDIPRTQWEGWWKKNARTFQPVDDVALMEKYAERFNEDTEFYGLDVEGDPVVFMLDASNSMKGEQWERLKQESRSMFSGLPYELDFAVVMFPVAQFPKSGYTNDAGDEASNFVDYIELKGSTPMAYATHVAFEKHMGRGKKLPDTLYMLTDGRPTDSRGDDEFDAMHLALFPGNCVRIHTICIGQVSPMLEVIAEEHGGQYVVIGAKEKKKKKDKKKK